MNTNSDDSSPATKGDIQGLVALMERIATRFDARMDRLDARMDRLDARMDALDARMDALEARIEQVETSLLTAFHQWAQTYETRARGTSRAVAELDERLGFIEERVSRLERRPPSA